MTIGTTTQHQRTGRSRAHTGSTPTQDAAPPPPPGVAARIGILAYATLAYAAFAAAITYAMGFVTGLVTPTTVHGRPGASLWTAITINTLMLLAFAIQHVVMARKPFKAWWDRVAPRGTCRATFTLAASAILAVLFYVWRSIDFTLWTVSAPWLRATLHGLTLGGFGIVVLASFQIDHFHLFGLKQAWAAARGRELHASPFCLRGLYRWVRHPLMTGFLLAFWSAPDMSGGRLLFAAATTGYILIGTRIEERDLIREHGEDYLRYRRDVPAFFPRLLRTA